MGQYRIDLETHWVHKILDRDKQSKNTTLKTKKMSNHIDPIKNTGVKPDAREGQVVHASYKVLDRYMYIKSEARNVTLYTLSTM